MEMRPQTIWASVAVIGILVCSATTLVILDKDVSIILTLAALVALPVLGAFGASIYHKLDKVQDLSNGNLQRLQEIGENNMNRFMEAQKDSQEKLTNLAMAMTPAAPSPAGEITAAPALDDKEKS